MAVEFRHRSIRSLADPKEQICFLSALQKYHIIAALDFAQLVNVVQIVVMLDFVFLFRVRHQTTHVIKLNKFSKQNNVTESNKYLICYQMPETRGKSARSKN